VLLDRAEALSRAVIDWGAASPWRSAALVGLVALAVILPGLWSLPVTDRDEARFAQASKQMLETGDLVDIRLQDEPRWKKPVGIYWLQAAAAGTLGGGPQAGIWAYRLPSAAAGVLSALMVVWAARPLIGARGAVLAGLILATTLLAVVEAHIAKTDAALMASAVGALGAMARLALGHGGRGAALVFWLAIAASILLKGPVVPAIVLLTLGTLWVAGHRPDWRRFRPASGLALTAVLVAPWLFAISHVSDGAFFAEALGRDLGGKLVEGQESHWGPPGLYLLLVWLTLWPWAALIPRAVPWLWRRREKWVVLLAGWVLPFWLVLELVPTKLPHYVLPLYPALAIALAAFVSVAAPVPAPHWARWAGAALVALPALVLALAIAALPALLSTPALLLGDMPGLLAARVSWPAVLLGLAGGAAALLAARAALAGRAPAQAGASVLSALLLYPAALAFGLPALGTGFPSPELARAIAQYRPCASGPAWSVGYHEPSLVFLTETGIRLDDPGGAVAALRTDPGALVLVEERWREILGQDAFAGAVVREEVSYFNYNRGKATTARLLTPDDSRWDACAG
jgi:4-amino-4-deoxy-L-arabinose transferase-like glycosyltransferase